MRSAAFPGKREPVSGGACTGCRWGATGDAERSTDGNHSFGRLGIAGERRGPNFPVFYYTASAAGVLVFHAFAKKTQRTRAPEIELARKRLKELLDA